MDAYMIVGVPARGAESLMKAKLKEIYKSTMNKLTEDATRGVRIGHAQSPSRPIGPGCAKIVAILDTLCGTWFTEAAQQLK
jgi:hypothetical protein